MSKLKKFKIKITEFNINILNFIKIAYFWEFMHEEIENIFYVNNLNLELKALTKLKEIYEEFLKQFSLSIADNEKLL